MDALALTEALAVPAATGAVSWWIGGRGALRKASRAAATQRRGQAAASLRGAVQGLHDVLWDRCIGEPVDESAIAEAMTAFERLARRHEYLLPAGSVHLRLSVREAMTCVFGAPAVAALHCDARRRSADAFDGYWADVSLTWLEHAVGRLHDWEDDPRVKRLPLQPYYSWRRDEDDEYRARGAAAADGAPPGALRRRGGPGTVSGAAKGGVACCRL